MIKKLTTIRCSALPAAFTCAGSVHPPDVQIDPVCDPADQGNAAHDVMQAIVDMDAPSTDGIDLAAIADRWNADEDDLRIQAFVGVKIWKQLRDSMPNAQAEVELRESFDLGDGFVIELTGHLDALALIPKERRARLGDWKFGRADKNHSHQVRGYEALVLAKYPDTIDDVEGFVGWMAAKDGEIEHYSMNRDQMWAWLEDLKARVLNWDGVFHPGPQCTWCPRNHACPAMTAMARRDVLVLGEPGMAAKIVAGIQDLTDGDLIALYRRGRVIAKLIESLDDTVKRRVDAAGGALPDGDGRELRFIESARRVIAPLLARPVLEERLTTEEIAACTVLRPSKLDSAISDKTERGKKKQAIEELDTALRAAGAVKEEPNRMLKDLRTKGAS